MGGETRVWNILNIIAILLPPCIVPLFIWINTPDQFTRKRLESLTPITSDVTSAFAAFRALGNDVNITITQNGTSLNNLAVSVVEILNIGKVPIIPTDYYAPLSLNVDTPWKIIAIKNAASPQEFIWKKVSDQRFEMPPELLNPGDAILASVYATNVNINRYQMQR